MIRFNYRCPTDTAPEPALSPPLTEPQPTHGGGRARRPELELWGGLECTVNRVGDRYLDQLERSGHAHRVEDLELFRDLGIRTLRYPVLWERTAPHGPASADWTWADERLRRLQELEIRPIVGLVHHGSGPRETSLLDPCFPEKLAEYAGAVAERYPWVDAYTPVNEITTTARFSALYGHWYPHARDGGSFARAMVHQARATVLAMQAIRRVNPRARLIQTDDLGKTHGTPPLAHQARFDNTRRWLGWDLLCGMVDHEHPLWTRLIGDGLPQGELEWLLEHPCPPDVLGVNYYITSERFLDHRLERYPEWTQGGNAFQRYADVEAVRVCTPGIHGAETLLREAWERYGIPIAVTETHLGCTREEQLRWLLEVWETAAALRREGADIRAVTVWSLLGAFDWNSLLTRDLGYYEPGVFDLRGGQPRPTALAWLARELAHGREPRHPALTVPGWWRRPERLHYPAEELECPALAATARSGNEAPGSFSRSSGRRRPILISGATGTLGRAFARLCEVRGLPYRLTSRRTLDITVPFCVEDVLDDLQPWAVVNAAGYVRVDDAEKDAERCMRENAEGAEILARACAHRGVPLVTFSSDLVFDGAKGAPYVESDPVRPLNVYGRSKAEAEQRVLAAHPEALMVRTSAFFGPWDDYNFVTVALRELAAGRPFPALEDVRISPTYVPDLVNAALDLLIDRESGIWHLANEGSITWYELARQAAAMAGVGADTLIGQRLAELDPPAPRPAQVVLDSERGRMLPSLEHALERYVEAREQVERQLVTVS